VAVNPVRGIEKPKDAKRNRRLSDAEYAQLGAALNGSMISDIFRLLAVTGFRSSEAKNLQWKEVDLDRRTIVLADTKNVRPLSNGSYRNNQKTEAKRRSIRVCSSSQQTCEQSSSLVA
jgi:integrase